MANVTEISQFDAGIYQLETTDVVEGGSLGVDNYQAKGLANRTRWLYDNIVKLFNLQKVITTNYTLLNSDNNYTIFINNGSTPVTITLNASINTASFQVGFVQEGTGSVTYVSTGVSLTNPIGMKGKGAGFQQFIERKQNEQVYYLLGNTKL